MASPVDFPESNFTLLGGKTGAMDLKCFRGQDQFVSCWQLTPEEIKEINETGRFYVSVFSRTTAPPIWAGGNPFITPEQLAADYFLVNVQTLTYPSQIIEKYVPNRLKNEYWAEFSDSTPTESELTEFLAKHS